MILTHGNIKKSKFLRYVFVDDLSTDEYQEKMNQYQQTIENDENREYLKIQSKLHDSYFSIIQNKNEIIFDMISWNNIKESDEKYRIIFKKGQIVSWNKCIRQFNCIL